MSLTTLAVCERAVYEETRLDIGNSVWLLEWLVLNSNLTKFLDLLFLPSDILMLSWNPRMDKESEQLLRKEGVSDFVMEKRLCEMYQRFPGVQENWLAV